MSSFNVLVATDLTDESLTLLRDAQDIKLTVVTPTHKAVREVIKTAHALITRDDVVIDAELLQQAPDLRIIARVSAGLDNMDVETATARGIIIMNMPGVSAVAAAEHTLGLMLALSRKLVIAHNSLKDGWWLLDRKRQAGTQLNGKTLGVIGLGRVGQRVAAYGLALSMKVIAFDPYINEDYLPLEQVTLVGLGELLAEGDFVTVHVPATRETMLMFDARTISRMKQGARLINTSHGGVIHEEALADALKEGHLAGAAVDVYTQEPPYTSPLVGMDTVIHTPRIGDNTLEAMQDLSLKVVQQVIDALRDVDYRNVINMPLMPGVDFETVRPYMRLADCIGHLQYTLARSAVRRVAVEVQGETFERFIKPMTVGILKGLLTPMLGEEVSFINAPILATERGWHITQTKGLKVGEYSNSLTCQITLEDNEEITITGTLMDQREPHITQINQYRMNFVPGGFMLLMGSYDKPGVIGTIGTLMARNSVNIASWHTGRAEPGGNTLTVITLDDALPDPVLRELESLDFVRHVHQAHI